MRSSLSYKNPTPDGDRGHSDATPPDDQREPTGQRMGLVKIPPEFVAAKTNEVPAQQNSSSIKALTRLFELESQINHLFWSLFRLSPTIAMNSDPGFLDDPEAVSYGFLLQIRQGLLKSQDDLALAVPAQPQDHDAGEKVGRIRTDIRKMVHPVHAYF